jgi:hypothetical protein
MPDHSVNGCGCGAAAPDVQAVADSETSNAAIANLWDDVLVTGLFGGNDLDYTGTIRARAWGDDN